MSEVPLDPQAARRLLVCRQTSPSAFRAAVRNVPELERDAWIDRVFGLAELPPDGPELPRGCVPYLPCSVNTVLRMTELADIKADDIFVDIGSGLGRTIALTHFLTGAGAIGIEVQSALVSGSRALISRLNAPQVSVLEGDATSLTHQVTGGSVFFLYCPFSGARLDRVLDIIAVSAKSRRIRLCCVDLPLPPLPWLTRLSVSEGLAVYESRQ